MARIPESEIDRIKRETDLVALIQSRGTVLKQQGANWTGLCPFHDDSQTPNLIVTPAKGLFRCMASCCGKTGNAIQFVEMFDGVSFRHAFEVLANGGKVAFEQSGGQAKKATVPKLPCPIVLTTTSIDIDEELMNRCLVLTVDESKEQTERIHELQREARTIEGLLATEKRKDIVRVMQNAQRLIEPMRVANPFARHLTFTSGRTRTRRDHEKYLTLIDSIALLHQHQREVITHTVNGREVKMLPVTFEDIEAANRIAPEVLGRSLDELPPQTRRLLEHIKELVRERMEEQKFEQRLALFSRRELREKTGWSQTQIRRHLERLLELEHVNVRGGRNGVQMKYELLLDASEQAGAFHVGLIDVEELKQKEAKKEKAA